MFKNWIFFLIIVGLSACDYDDRLGQSSVLKSANMDEKRIAEKVWFKVFINSTNRKENIIQLNATLENATSDTIYFLLAKCANGMTSVQFDTSKFEFSNFISCNADPYPSIEKINPKSKYQFIIHLRNKVDEPVLKSGFDFYEVNKLVNLEGITLTDILNRPTERKSILWADEIPLK